MILKALEMQGFKSFPDKTVLKFEKGITAVVGPNGSGKSNISDAVRWVLGEQSTKSLRGSKMEDVIFNGTLARKKQGYAEVTLRMDNSDRALTPDADEVSVTRRYYRSGESEYKINGETARLRDVHELFMDTGLGRDGYSMVSQGKIADMISSKSGERREMFEEASGISHYRYRRADAQRRLSQAEENLTRLRDILTELESRVGPLRIQSEKAEKFLVLAGEKKELEIGIWLGVINRHKEKLRSQEHKISIAQSQHASAEKELAAAEVEIEAIAEEMQKMTAEIDTLRRSCAELEEEAAKIEGQAAVHENTVAHNGETIERIRRDMERSEDSGRDMEAEIARAQAEIENIEKSAEEKREELKNTAAEIEAIRNKNEKHGEELTRLSGEISAKTVALSDKRVEHSRVQSALEAITARVGSIDSALEMRKAAEQEAENQKKQANKALSEALEKMDSLSNSVKGYELRLQKRSERAEKLKKEYETAELEVRQKSSRIKMLEDLEKNMEGYSGSVKAVMREVKRGTLSGIHGALSQLIKVSPKYAAAIETALGAAVQFMVTDSENDAKRAINFLKDSRAGRATFLPITSIRGRILSENGLEDCAGFVDIASRLVECEERYSEIIRAQLGRTAVVEDMDSAIAIAKRYSYRFRLVTLDGQVINAGGSMTGGSRVQNAGILSRGNEIDKLKKDCAAMENKLSLMAQEYTEAKNELSASQADLSAAKADLAAGQEEAIRRDSDAKMAGERLETARNAAEELLREKNSSGSRVKELTESAEALLAETEKAAAELSELEKQAESLSGVREDAAAEREKLAEKSAEISLAIMAAEKDAEALRQNIEELRARQSGEAGRKKELEAEIEEIKAKSEELIALAAQLRTEAAEMRKKGSDSAGGIEKIVSSRSELEAKSSRLRVFERTKSTEREQISGELARLEEQKAAMLRENDETLAKLYDEYQLTRREAENQFTPAEDESKAKRQLAEVKNRIRSLGSVNVSAIEEYKEVSERYEFMRDQINDIEKSRDELYRLIDDLTKKMSVRFMEQFNKINDNFGKTFEELFGGGKASLSLEDPTNILECPINISVQPPGKAIQNIDLLSGGEKGLAAIALLFAILKVTPSPFCIFDEVEAALDDVNVTRYAQYVRRMTGSTQFILITHRRGTMEEADVLYGVTMQEKGISKLLELKTSELAGRLGIE